HALIGATGVLHAVADNTTLSLPGQMYGLELWRRFPISAAELVSAAPLLFVGVLAFVVLCLRRRAAWRDLALYGLPPLVVLLVMETLLGGQVRYLVATAPFLAVLAAAACAALPRGPGVALALLLVALPLAASLRFLALLDTINT